MAVSSRSVISPVSFPGNGSTWRLSPGPRAVCGGPGSCPWDRGGAGLWGFWGAFRPASAAGLAGSVVLLATLYLALRQDAATWVWLIWGTLFGMYAFTLGP